MSASTPASVPAFPDPDCWQQVNSRQDFAAFLRLLAVDSELARCRTTIGDFLWAWVGVLGRHRLDGSDVPHQEAAGRPGWRGLAYQLAAARTAPPAYNCVLADSRFAEPAEVGNANDLRMYAATLAMDVGRQRRPAPTTPGDWAGVPGTWAHRTLPGWLDAWSAWVAAESPLHARLEPVTWRSIALQLSAARVYE